MKKTNMLKIFFNGIGKENPVFRLVLGMCPTLAITKFASQGIGMGLAATFVLVGSNFAVSCLRKVIPDKIRIPAYIVIIATFVSIIQMLIKAYAPTLDASLGIFIPLIVVNCIIFARAESFASKNGPISSVMDALGMGLGFTISITFLASVREILGNGTFFDMPVFPEGFEPIRIIANPPGGFLTLGLLVLLINFLGKQYKTKKGSIRSLLTKLTGKKYKATQTKEANS